MSEYKGRGNYPRHYMSDYHFYRDLDPLVYYGDDPIDMTNINTKGNT